MPDLNWKGAGVRRDTVRRVSAGMDETMGACVGTAKIVVSNGGRMPFLTGRLQGSVNFKPTQEVEGFLIGVWGSFDVPYAKRQNDKHEFLQGSANENYPSLKERISNQ